MAKKSPPPAVMLNLIIGYCVSRLIYVAAKLELADRLNDGLRTVEELAVAAGARAPALYPHPPRAGERRRLRGNQGPTLQTHAARGDAPDGRHRLDARHGDDDGRELHV